MGYEEKKLPHCFGRSLPNLLTASSLLPDPPPRSSLELLGLHLELFPGLKPEAWLVYGGLKREELSCFIKMKILTSVSLSLSFFCLSSQFSFPHPKSQIFATMRLLRLRLALGACSTHLGT